MAFAFRPMTRHQRIALTVSVFAIAVSLTVGASSASAQGILDRVKQKAQDKKDKMVDSATEAAADSVVNRGASAAQCLATNIKCIKEALDKGEDVKVVDAKGRPAS